MLLAPLFATLVLVGHTNAFFRLPCDNPLIVERVDPIVSFGKVGGHTHTIAGASNFSPNATFADLRKSTCTSCRVKQDMSSASFSLDFEALLMALRRLLGTKCDDPAFTSCLKLTLSSQSPQLYIEWANNTFSSVDQVGGTLVYVPRPQFPYNPNHSPSAATTSNAVTLPIRPKSSPSPTASRCSPATPSSARTTPSPSRCKRSAGTVSAALSPLARPTSLPTTVPTA